MIKTISLFSLIVIKKGIFEKRLINAPVAPIATRSAGIAQHTKVLLLAKRTRICVNNDFFLYPSNSFY